MTKHHKKTPSVPKDEQWSSHEVFRKTHEFITSQIHFSKDWQPVVITLWAMGTYLHRKFSCYGHLWLNSPTTHSGKTKLLNVLHAVCYKALPPQLEPTAAVLFRFPSVIGGTLLLDEMDNLDPKKRGEVISVLNHYTKSGLVVRPVNVKKRFDLEKLPIYCPKVIAGIESLPVTLQDRCIRIVLHRKTSGEKVERLLPEDYERLKPLRDQMATWASRKKETIIKAYSERKRLGVPDEVNDDRLMDILEPLFAVASVLPRDVRKRLVEAAVAISKGRKNEESESNPIVASVQILLDHFPKHEEIWKLRTDKASDLLCEIPGIDDKIQAQALLRKLGFRSVPNKINKKVLRAYRVSKHRLKRLAEQYS